MTPSTLISAVARLLAVKAREAVLLVMRASTQTFKSKHGRKETQTTTTRRHVNVKKKKKKEKPKWERTRLAGETNSKIMTKP